MRVSEFAHSKDKWMMPSLTLRKTRPLCLCHCSCTELKVLATMGLIQTFSRTRPLLSPCKPTTSTKTKNGKADPEKAAAFSISAEEMITDDAVEIANAARWHFPN